VGIPLVVVVGGEPRLVRARLILDVALGPQIGLPRPRRRRPLDAVARPVVGTRGNRGAFHGRRIAAVALGFLDGAAEYVLRGLPRRTLRLGTHSLRSWAGDSPGPASRHRRGFPLDTANRLLEFESLARNIRRRERRIDGLQLADEGIARLV